MGRIVSSFTTVLVLLALTGCDDTRTVTQDEEPPAELQCALGEVARNGHCFCQTDAACAAGEYCDGVTGSCQPKPPEPPGDDAGVRTCTNGARRCAPSPAKAIQECKAGAWVDVETCPAEGACTPSATGYYCSICPPGQQRCQGANALEICSEKGDKWVAQTCPNDPSTGSPAACVNNRCQVCTPGTIRCSADGTSVETCAPDGSGFVTQYCFPTGKCDAATKACVPPFCTPGEKKCLPDGFTLSECAQDGSKFVDKDCRTLDQYATVNATCPANGNACVDPCGTAARSSSYQGCEYWATTTSNSELDAKFKGGAADGSQPTTTSEYAVVVSNPNTAAVTVTVSRFRNGVEEPAPTSPAGNPAGTLSIPAGSQQIIRLPWQSIVATGRAPYAYRLTSTLPVAAYQFNPVTAQLGTGINATYSQTNDASLLLPTHILGTSYVVLGQEHITIEAGTTPSCTSNADCPGPGNSCSGWPFKFCTKNPVLPVPAFFSIVGTQDGTTVTVKFSAATTATPATGGQGNVAAQARNSTKSFVLNRYEVLQFWSDVDGPAEQCSQSDDSRFKNVCRYKSDPTGTIVTSTKPVAVFSGADCTFKPYNKFACDHIEEEMVPFSTWGKSYAGAKSQKYKTSSGAFVGSPAPDYWRVVAGCGKRDCPNGTRFTISPAPQQIIQSQYCAGNVCTLPPIDPATSVVAPWLEFAHASDFIVAADQPIMLSQYFTGENANTGSAEGDPSLILTPPIEQWRTSYNVLTSSTYANNYLSLIAQSTSPGIVINGKALTTANFPGLQQSSIVGGYTVYRVPVGGGPQNITATSLVGVTVMGYSPYVSYGYTGGLDLIQITQINPGG